MLTNHFLAVLILSAIFLGAIFRFSTSKEPADEMEEEFRKRKRMFDERYANKDSEYYDEENIYN
jgi:hypothetical protein